MLATPPEPFAGGGHDKVHTPADNIENINPEDLKVAWQMITVLLDAVIMSPKGTLPEN